MVATTKKGPTGAAVALLVFPSQRYCGWRPIGTSQYFLPLKPYIATVAEYEAGSTHRIDKKSSFPSLFGVKGIGPISSEAV
jgi:hypothetical protein